MSDPRIVAWSDQFGALLRDKCREMQRAAFASGWDSVAHVFNDPHDDDLWRLVYEGGDYMVTNITASDDHYVVLDIESLGVNRSNAPR